MCTFGQACKNHFITATRRTDKKEFNGKRYIKI